MAAVKKATVYFDPDLHRAIRVRAAEADQSLSDVVNDALRSYLSEDVEDLKAIRTRKKEPTISFEQLVTKLKRDGKI